MNLKRNNRSAAFTLVEIAISMAIIGFALVAIIGVLPTGLNVQRDNRHETIINNDAVFFSDAIRSGARGLDDLTNHVFAITNFWTKYDTSVDPWVVFSTGTDGFSATNSDVNSFMPAFKPSWPITNGATIIGVLSMPKFTGAQSNYIVAYSYAMSGAASEMIPQNIANRRNFAFAHRMIVEINPIQTPAGPGSALARNLHEIRLTYRWPLYPNGSSGNGRQTYRFTAGGSLVRETPLHWYFYPETYAQTR